MLKNELLGFVMQQYILRKSSCQMEVRCSRSFVVSRIFERLVQQSPPNFASNIKRSLSESINFYFPWYHQKSRGFLMISEDKFYLSNRKQRIKNNSTYSSWEESLFQVPLGSIFGPLLFNIFCLTCFG